MFVTCGVVTSRLRLILFGWKNADGGEDVLHNRVYLTCHHEIRSAGGSLAQSHFAVAITSQLVFSQWIHQTINIASVHEDTCVQQPGGQAARPAFDVRCHLAQQAPPSLFTLTPFI